MDKQDILLKDFHPQSALVSEEHKKDTPKFPIIDAHTHFGYLMYGDDFENAYDTAETMERLKACGVVKIVNLDGKNGDVLQRMKRKLSGYEDYVINFGSLDTERFESPDFEKYVKVTAARLKDEGIKGLKFWKTVGLKIKGKDGTYLRPDSERLKVIWEVAAELDMPVLFHIADPVAFFKPIDEKNERFEELTVHPDWSFCGNEFYTFDELMEMQERLLEQNPKTRFVIPHMGSFCENLKKVSEWLTKYQNMYIDTADRIAEIGRQPYTSREFFIKHQDRILFGTDFWPEQYDKHPIYFRFFESFDEYFPYSNEKTPPQGRWNIYGLGLPDDVLEKLYYKNAEKLLNIKVL